MTIPSNVTCKLTSSGKTAGFRFSDNRYLMFIELVLLFQNMFLASLPPMFLRLNLL